MGTAGGNPTLHSPPVRPGSAIFLAPPYLAQCRHSPPETNPPQKFQVLKWFPGLVVQGRADQQQGLLLGILGSRVGTGRTGRRGRLWRGAAQLLLMHVGGPCAVLGRDTVRQTLTLHRQLGNGFGFGLSSASALK